VVFSRTLFRSAQSKKGVFTVPATPKKAYIDITLAKQLVQGDSAVIPTENSFQFRKVSREPLTILIVTIPKWPGKDEAVLVDGAWAAHVK
jgi:hypothetical protein